MKEKAFRIDLAALEKKIHSNEDRPLFKEAIKCAGCGALRAAYVMIWICCAESLKRRFKDAQHYDGQAAKISSEIQEKESQHKSIDKYILEKARDYGFISDTCHISLNNIYELRCVYGHPYEQSPSEIQVLQAAELVVKDILSKPVKLRQGFAEDLIKKMVDEPNFLSDDESMIIKFAETNIQKINREIYPWIISRYCKEIESMSGDPTRNIFHRRAIIFCRAVIMSGMDAFPVEWWHAEVLKFPNALTTICLDEGIFKNVGCFAQDSLVGTALQKSNDDISVLGQLEKILHCMTTAQKESFWAQVNALDVSKLYSSGIPIKIYYEKIISAMKSHNWYTQNPAVSIAINNIDQVNALLPEQQIEIGRNILQCADGRERAAMAFVCSSIDKLHKNVLVGLIAEMFVNERAEIRFKDNFLRQIFEQLQSISPEIRTEIVTYVSQLLIVGSPIHYVYKNHFDEQIIILEDFTWATPLVTALLSKKEDAPELLSVMPGEW